MRELKRNPYHIFTVQDNNYYFDIPSSTLLKIDNTAYNYLNQGIVNPSKNLNKIIMEGNKNKSNNLLCEMNLLLKKKTINDKIFIYDEQEDNAYIKKLANMPSNKIELFLAEECNFRCNYCYVNNNNALKNVLMSKDIAKKAVNLLFFRASGFNDIIITFFGGEPLLNKEVLYFVVDYSQKLGKKKGKKIHYSLTTNATLMDEDIMRIIKRYNFGLMISMDGPKEIHDKMRVYPDGKGTFDKVAEMTKKLMRIRNKVTVRCTVTNQFLDIIKLIQFFEEFGFSRIALSHCMGKPKERNKWEIGQSENTILNQQYKIVIEHLLSQLSSGRRVIINPWRNAIKAIHNRAKVRIRCGVCRGCATVDTEGNIFPCHRYVGMNKYIIGNIEDGFNKKSMIDFLQLYYKTKDVCKECWAIFICGGFCPWCLSHEDGSVDAPLDWWCNNLKEWFEYGSWLYDIIRTKYPGYLKMI